MTPELSIDRRRAIEQQGGTPIHILDAVTKISYVLMSAEDYEKMKALTELDDVASMYPLLADLAPADWEDTSDYEKRP